MSPTTPTADAAPPGALARFFAGDVWYSFKRSPVAMASALLVLLCGVAALGAPVLAPHNPFDLATLDLSDARLPPAWLADGKAAYLLGNRK